MPKFDDLQRASFGGIAFPVKEVRIKCSYKKFVHEYLRVPGGVVEKLERGLYTITMEAVFDSNIKGYGELWPKSLKSLREKFERGETGPLVVPTVGTIPALITDWDQVASMGTIRSGESCSLPFLEDQTQLFLADAALAVTQSNIETATANFKLTANNYKVKQDIVDKIVGHANSILAYKDQADLYGGVLAARVEALTALLLEADSALEDIKDPLNYELLDAMQALWEAAVDLGRELAFSPAGPRFYTVPSVMSVSDISVAIYGNTSRAAEIMLNNDLEDPFAVPAGTTILYFVG